jgi:hypothetical protein
MPAFPSASAVTVGTARTVPADDAMKPAAIPSASAITVGTARKMTVPAAFPSASAITVGAARKSIVPADVNPMMPAAVPSASAITVGTARKLIVPAEDPMMPAPSASAITVGTARKSIVPDPMKPAAIPSASASTDTARNLDPVVEPPFVRRSSRLARAAEISAVSKIAPDVKIPLRASKRVPRAAQCVTPVTLSSCVDAVSMSSVESKTQVTSPSADLTLAHTNCSRFLEDTADDGHNDDDDDNDNERCVQTAKRLAGSLQAERLTGRGSMQATALKR